MKTNAIIRIVLFSLAILILASVLIGALAFDMYIFDGKVQFDHIDTHVADVANGQHPEGDEVIGIARCLLSIICGILIKKSHGLSSVI